jgi:4-amino-4-deoxy-L-arabinose transferase-like glycosyltransferase
MAAAPTEQSAVPAPAPARGRRAVGVVLWTLALSWSLLQVVYFLRTNTGLWFDGPLGFGGVFRGLLARDWSFALTHCPPLALLGALLVAAMTTALGVRLLHALGVRLRPLALGALGFGVGLGVSGLAFELLTMARLLHTLPAWGVWVLLFGATEWFARCRALPSIEPESPESAAAEPIEARLFWWAGAALAGAITFAIFWHALLFPETYWDSLILYLGYGWMTFLEHGFPFKAVGQVGIGLGANYPHLFSTYGAMASTLFGHWSDLHQRLAAPLAGLATTLLIYETARMVWHSRAAGIAAALAWRSVPLGIAYSTYASDYAVAILLAAMLLHAVALFTRTRHRGPFALLLLIPAVGMHVNYLMGILWVPAFLAIGLVWWGSAGRLDGSWRLNGRWAVGVLLVCLVAGSTWNVRNWVLTGNPVYAFFSGLFPGSIHMNDEVMKSADLEWFRNGDGVGRLAELMVDIEAGRSTFRDQEAAEFDRQARLPDRLRASWWYWQGFETLTLRDDGTVARGRWIDRATVLLHLFTPMGPGQPPAFRSPGGAEIQFLYWRHAYKLSPFFLGFALPGLLLAGWIVGRRSAWRQGAVAPTVLAIATVLAGGLLAYHYLLADYYLYQIIPILPPLALLVPGLVVGMPARAPRFTDSPQADSPSARPCLFGRVYRSSAYALVLVAGLVPGLAMSLMNFKFHSPAVVHGQMFVPQNLDLFRHPGIDGDLFYRLVFGEDVDAWKRVNELAAGQPVLTHDNRHLMYDPSIELVHLDDWDVQATYTMTSPDERLRFFRDRGIRYYLRIPNEHKHRINRRAGLDELIARGDLVLIESFGPNELYEFRPAPEAP